MTIPRIFQADSLAVGDCISLTAPAAHHLMRVLRTKVHDKVIIFNGCGGEYAGYITHHAKNQVNVYINDYTTRNTESPLNLILAQGLAKGEKMDYIIQKAVELGVKGIVPLLTKYSNVKLDANRVRKKLQHWQGIIISACEQSGRTMLPFIEPPIALAAWLERTALRAGFILSPYAQATTQTKRTDLRAAELSLLIGPEGGLAVSEVGLALAKGMMPLCLGPRILRTETASLAAITAIQCRWGDMAAEDFLG